jgi:branched-chain amino acid transport system substrate-binding protein
VFFLENEYSAYSPVRMWFRRAARRIGLQIVGSAVRDVDHTTRYRALAERVRASGAGALYLNDSAYTVNIAPLLHELRQVLGHRVEIIGSIGFLSVPVLFAKVGADARGMLITSYGLLPEALGPGGQRFIREFGAAEHEHRVTNVDVYAAAATEVLLDAIARSDGTREGIARALKRTRLADSVVGPLALEPDGEPASNPVTYVRARRGGGSQDVLLSVDGADVVGVIDVPKRLVGPGR